MNVIFGVGDVVVAADDEVRSLLPEFVYVLLKIMQKLHFHPLPQFSTGTRWEVTIQHRYFPKIGPKYPTLTIVH